MATRSFAPLVAAVVLGFGFATSPAIASGTSCPAWMCGTSNGQYLNGVQMNGQNLNGVQIRGAQEATGTHPVVDSIVLPSGEVIELR